MEVIELGDVKLANIKIDPDYIIRKSLYRKLRAKGLKGIEPDVEELAASMQSVGLLQPISVTPTAYKRYTLIIGLRRLLAAKMLKWETIESQVVV